MKDKAAPEQSPSRREAADAGKDIALAPVTPEEVIAMFQRMAAAISPEAQRYAYWLWDGEKVRARPVRHARHKDYVVGFPRGKYSG